MRILNRAAIWIVTGAASFFSLLQPRVCRFYPSCSQYSKEAFRQLSFMQATYRTILRLLRCQPFSPGGYDPVRPTSGEIVKWKKEL